MQRSLAICVGRNWRVWLRRGPPEGGLRRQAVSCRVNSPHPVELLSLVFTKWLSSADNVSIKCCLARACERRNRDEKARDNGYHRGQRRAFEGPSGYQPSATDTPTGGVQEVGLVGDRNQRRFRVSLMFTPESMVDLLNTLGENRRSKELTCLRWFQSRPDLVIELN